MTTYSFYLKDREDPVDVEGVTLEDDGTRLRVMGRQNVVLAVFLWSELQGFTTEQ